MSDAAAGEVTLLLRRMAAGDDASRARLAEVVYAELRDLAGRQLRGLQGHTLQPTALVHEAWLRLAGGDADFANRQHFLAVAAKAMRSALVDYTRRRRAEKRGGGARHTSLDDTIAFLEGGEVDLLDLDEALAALESTDSLLARLVEMRFFSGMTNKEIAAVENCSESTIERSWRLARAWLRQRLNDGTGP